MVRRRDVDGDAQCSGKIRPQLMREWRWPLSIGTKTMVSTSPRRRGGGDEQRKQFMEKLDVGEEVLRVDVRRSADMNRKVVPQKEGRRSSKSACYSTVCSRGLERRCFLRHASLGLRSGAPHDSTPSEFRSSDRRLQRGVHAYATGRERTHLRGATTSMGNGQQCCVEAAKSSRGRRRRYQVCDRASAASAWQRQLQTWALEGRAKVLTKQRAEPRQSQHSSEWQWHHLAAGGMRF